MPLGQYAPYQETTGCPPAHLNGVHPRPNWHHQAALANYSKALAYLRKDMETKGLDARLTMIATLLFIVFENMQGNYHAAGSLIISGIKVFSTLRSGFSAASSAPGSPESTTPSPTTIPSFAGPIPPPLLPEPDEEMSEMMQMFARHSIVTAHSPFPHCKLAYHLLLDQRLSDRAQDMIVARNPTTLEQLRMNWDYTFPSLGRFFQKCAWRNFNRAYVNEDGETEVLQREKC